MEGIARSIVGAFGIYIGAKRKRLIKAANFNSAHERMYSVLSLVKHRTNGNGKVIAPNQ